MPITNLVKVGVCVDCIALATGTFCVFCFGSLLYLPSLFFNSIRGDPITVWFLSLPRCLFVFCFGSLPSLFFFCCHGFIFVLAKKKVFYSYPRTAATTGALPRTLPTTSIILSTRRPPSIRWYARACAARHSAFVLVSQFKGTVLFTAVLSLFNSPKKNSCEKKICLTFKS